MKVIVIYFDGNEYSAIEVETETPDSSMPHVFGLEHCCEIIAVIENPGNKYTVYIEEDVALEGKANE